MIESTEKTAANDLENAFEVFNQMSEQLASSYQSLQDQVQQLAEELAESRSERVRLADRLEQLLNVLPGGVVVIDSQGVVAECNPAAYQLLGESLLGLKWGAVTERVFEKHQHEHAGLQTRDGRYLTVASSQLEQEAVTILLFHDVTENRMLQKNLSRHERLSSMGEMAASLAHQIRTPLSSAMLYTSNLVRDDLSVDDQRKFANKIRSRLQHLEGLVGGMLSYARGGDAHRENIVLDDLLEAFQKALETQTQSGECRLQVMQDMAVGVVMQGDSDALLTALQNLVNNAIDAAGHGVEICLKVNLHEDFVVLSLSDNGPGIDPVMQERIFEPFFTGRVRGTGLGLAVVQAVTDAHGGTVHVRSIVGQGATFELRLPIFSEENILSGHLVNPQEVRDTIEEVK
jgi:two-component system, sensor histidine kinase FlrB